MRQLRFTCYKFCYILLQLLPRLYSVNAVHVEHDKLSVKRLKFLKVFEIVQMCVNVYYGYCLEVRKKIFHD